MRSQASRLISLYRATFGQGDARELYYQIATDYRFRGPDLAAADAHSSFAPTFVYRLTQASSSFDGLLGIPHAMKIPFIFATYTEPLMQMLMGDSPELVQVSDKMQSLWTDFAQGRSPFAADSSASDAPPSDHWPRYTSINRTSVDIALALRADTTHGALVLSLWAEKLAALATEAATDAPMRAAVIHQNRSSRFPSGLEQSIATIQSQRPAAGVAITIPPVDLKLLRRRSGEMRARSNLAIATFQEELRASTAPQPIIGESDPATKDPRRT